MDRGNSRSGTRSRGGRRRQLMSNSLPSGSFIPTAYQSRPSSLMAPVSVAPRSVSRLASASTRFVRAASGTERPPLTWMSRWRRFKHVSQGSRPEAGKQLGVLAVDDELESGRHRAPIGSAVTRAGLRGGHVRYHAANHGRKRAIGVTQLDQRKDHLDTFAQVTKL